MAELTQTDLGLVMHIPSHRSMLCKVWWPSDHAGFHIMHGPSQRGEVEARQWHWEVDDAV